MTNLERWFLCAVKAIRNENYTFSWFPGAINATTRHYPSGGGAVVIQSDLGDTESQLLLSLHELGHIILNSVKSLSGYNLCEAAVETAAYLIMDMQKTAGTATARRCNDYIANHLVKAGMNTAQFTGDTRTEVKELADLVRKALFTAHDQIFAGTEFGDMEIYQPTERVEEGAVPE